ncbi:MAG: signal peptidase I [Candidatus Brockarchaeota archaeon]|nr:signal peptidase I [Candidatus Brockarchaeota archaeon]
MTAVLPLTLFFLYQPRIAIIASSSMRPTLEPGDAVLIVKVKPDEIRVGDIISYVKVIPLAPVAIVTHRVVEVGNHGNLYIFKTKGDGNSNPDGWDITS